MSWMTNKRNDTGFTLFELVITMLVVGILAAIGVPSFRYVTNSNRMATELNGFVGDLQFARSEAVKEGLPVTICSSTDGLQCANSNDWSSGWIVFSDSNGNRTVEVGETVLKIQRPFTGGDTFIASSAAFQALVFNREGYAATGVAAIVAMTLHSAPVNAQWTRCLAVTSVGALTVEKSGDTLPTACT